MSVNVPDWLEFEFFSSQCQFEVCAKQYSHTVACVGIYCHLATYGENLLKYYVHSEDSYTC